MSVKEMGGGSKNPSQRRGGSNTPKVQYNGTGMNVNQWDGVTRTLWVGSAQGGKKPKADGMITEEPGA